MNARKRGDRVNSDKPHGGPANGTGTTEAKYRREWALKTGKPESEIYVPEHIRGK